MIRKFEIITSPHVGYCFGVMRAMRLIEQGLESFGGTIYTLGDVIHNPLEVVQHITEHIRKGGKLWETYTVMDDPRTKDWTSFRQAQQQRPAVFDYIRANYKLLKGPDPDIPKDSGRRCWEKL